MNVYLQVTFSSFNSSQFTVHVKLTDVSKHKITSCQSKTSTWYTAKKSILINHLVLHCLVKSFSSLSVSVVELQLTLFSWFIDWSVKIFWKIGIHNLSESSAMSKFDGFVRPTVQNLKIFNSLTNMIKKILTRSWNQRILINYQNGCRVIFNQSNFVCWRSRIRPNIRFLQVHKVKFKTFSAFLIPHKMWFHTFVLILPAKEAACNNNSW